MKKTTLTILSLVALIGILTLTVVNREKTEPTTKQPQTERPTVIKPSRQPIVHYPVPETPLEPKQKKGTEAETTAEQISLPETLPPVQQSDETIQEVLGKLITPKSSFKLLNMQNFIQKLVVTVDSLPEKRLPGDHLPISRPKGRFIASGTIEAPQTSSRNHRRYTEIMALCEAIAPEQAVKVYVHFYPLFQTAYQELGYPNAYFNDRLVSVIDHLLEAPDPAEPILLAQPSVLYTYANPLLEKRSAGQKMLLRAGPENRRRIMKLLRTYRKLLINLKP